MQLPSRLQKELQTMKAMVKIYCRNHHHENSGGVCNECSELLRYAQKRLSHCPFQANKPTCGRCHIHCYNKEMQTNVKNVMRYSGPKMIWNHPFMALQHFLSGRNKPQQRDHSPNPCKKLSSTKK